MLTEKEKAKNQLLYDSNDGTLTFERNRCKDLCHQFNSLSFSDKDEQTRLIKQLFAKTGEKFCITAPLWCDYGYNIEIGENFYTNHNCIILDIAKIKFGDNVFIAPNCCFSTVGHPIDSQRRNSGLEFGYPIDIGNNVWIGANTTVLPGITIGDNVVIGAGSLVNKDIPANVIAAGNPCKIIRAISEEDKTTYIVRPNSKMCGRQ